MVIVIILEMGSIAQLALAGPLRDFVVSAICQDLHRHPELSTHEVRSSKTIAKLGTSLNLEIVVVSEAKQSRKGAELPAFLDCRVAIGSSQ